MADVCVGKDVRKSQTRLPIELCLGRGQSERFMFQTVLYARLHELKWSGLWPGATLALQTRTLMLFQMLQHLGE